MSRLSDETEIVVALMYTLIETLRIVLKFRIVKKSRTDIERIYNTRTKRVQMILILVSV